jgi:hypothetical protein
VIDNQLIDSISQQTLQSIEQRRPTVFDGLYTVNNFLPESAVVKLKNYLPTSNESLWSPVAGQEKVNRLKLTWETDTIVEEIHEACNRLTPAVGKLASLPLNFIGLQIWKDWDGYRITPHRDNSIIDVSLQIYLFDNDSKLGTTFSEGDCTIDIPYIHNSGYMLVANNNNPTHRTTQDTPIGVTRYSLYLVWSKTTKL